MLKHKAIAFGAIFVAAIILLAAPVIVLSKDTAQADSTSSLGFTPNHTVDKYTDIAKVDPDVLKPGYIDPITKQAREMKAKGINDSEIIKEFEKQGIIYYPDSDSWVKGRCLTKDEMKEKKIIFPVYDYNDKGMYLKAIYYGENDTMVNVSEQKPSVTTQAAITSIGQINVWVETTDPYKFAYLGWGGHIIPGSEAADISGTEWHFVTTHLGSSGSCTELGVYRSESDSVLTVYSYDNRVEPGHPLYTGTTPIHPAPSSDNGAIIIVTGTWESGSIPGYVYYLYWNGQQFRRGHLTSLYNQINQANEAIPGSDDTHYSVDSQHAIFYGQSVYKTLDSSGNYAVYGWVNNANTPSRVSGDWLPMKQVTSYGYTPYSYVHESWVQSQN